MSNSTKRITMAIDFMITCPLDHPRGHIVSIPWDIIVPLLRIPIAINLHQQCPNPYGYIEGKNPNLFIFQVQIRVRNMHNYRKFFLNTMHSRKITLLYFKGIQKVLTKTIPHIRMFLNQIHIVKMKIEISKVSLINLKSFAWWLKPLSWHTSSEEEKMVEAMALNLSRW